MDLKSFLAPDDLFISYWLEQGLTLVLGDRHGIISTESLVVPGLAALIADFEEEVSDERRYAMYIAEQYRPAVRPLSDRARPSMPALIASLGSLLATPALCERVSSGVYRRLILFPDGILNALPLHLLIDSTAGTVWHRAFPDGVLYAPSASTYAYACAKRREGMPRHAAILIGDADDPGIEAEAEKAAQKMPCPASFIRKMTDLSRIAPETDILYVATHGQSARGLVAEDDRGHEGWSLSFADGSINARDFFSERIKLAPGAVAVLSACSAGHMMARQVHEIEGAIQALFYAGASTILAARWPILYESAEAVFIGTMERVYQGRCSFGAALNQAIVAAAGREDLNHLMVGQESGPFFWGPFAIFGCGN